MMYTVDIIQTGSTGNAIVIDDHILIDCGVPKKAILDVLPSIDHIFISHKHSDHLNLACLKYIAKNYPQLIRFGLHINHDIYALLRDVAPEVAALIETQNIIKSDTYERKTPIITRTKSYTFTNFALAHDVENQATILKNEDGETLIHATDTSHLNACPDMQFDCVLVEANWDELKLDEALKANDYETRMRAEQNLRHLSIQAFDRFCAHHTKPTSQKYRLHESDTFGLGLDPEVVANAS